MENLFLKYMSKRLEHKTVAPLQIHEMGPVITISRQTGCGASGIAYKLSEALNSQGLVSGKQKWNYINREILERSAEKLNLEPDKLRKVLTDKERGIMDEIVEAFSQHSHISDIKIMKTMQEVIRQFAESGNVIIVGRGGASISHDIIRSLHIRLEAPEEWRLEVIMKRLSFSRDFAVKYLRQTDEERSRYTLKMMKGTPSVLYDITINRSRFTDEQVVETILQAATIKKLF